MGRVNEKEGPEEVVHRFLAGLGEASLAFRVRREEIRGLYYQPEARQEALDRGEPVLEVSLAAPPPRREPLSDGAVALVWVDQRRRHVVAPSGGSWRIRAIEDQCPSCRGEGCPGCEGAGWTDALEQIGGAAQE